MLLLKISILRTAIKISLSTKITSNYTPPLYTHKPIFYCCLSQATSKTATAVTTTTTTTCSQVRLGQANCNEHPLMIVLIIDNGEY